MPEEADKHHALLYKEWDEASCPICMDHPHNAVLLLCSSHDKGCRSYICDTSYRHSNCLDRFKKVPEKNFHFPPSPPTLVTGGIAGGSEPNRIDFSDNNYTSEPKLNLKCPLCRGDVFGWKVIEEARNHLNLKLRNCSRESCSYVGNYKELRLHARRAHPTVRPTEVDPSRQRAWRSLEEQREYDDIISAVRTAMPGAMVLGDYVIENGGDRVSTGSYRERGDGLMSTFFLVQMFGSMGSMSNMRRRSGDRSRTLSRYRRSNGSFPRRRFLWGENLLGLQDEGRRTEEDDAADSDRMNHVAPSDRGRRRRRRQRRRLM
ncbi:unnamed protein product [Cuscuta campestris]|uniref:Uncharacterized protein n=1 Tax=Cuscuta campestris TaxID=132261 RepID=A0A484MBZ7_9ASTE|nr:unnamed protein product [Cuscuta campestris]